MNTFWNHRCAIAHLSATDHRWKDVPARKMNDALAKFMRRSNCSVILDDFPWISRLRARVYCRCIECTSNGMTIDKRRAKPAIVNFT